MTYFLGFLLSLILAFSPSLSASIEPQPSLRDKIGQMLLIGFEGKKVNKDSPIVQSLEKYNLGGVLLFDYAFYKNNFDKNIESPKQVRKLTADLQYFNGQANLKQHRPVLPLLIAIDYEGGRISRISEQFGFPPIPSAREVGQKTMAEANTIAETMAQTLTDVGINLDFAPVLDVNVNPENPVIAKKERSFSNKASAVSQYAAIYSHHFLQHHILCAYKHFPGHGSSATDSHLGFVDVTETWKAYELDPYQQLLASKDSCGMVMTAHIVNRHLDASGLPATLSYNILTKLLREKLQFKGVIITDDLQMKAINDNYGLEQALVLAINAGADMLIFGNNISEKPQDPRHIIDLIETNVLSGKISRERISEAYQHIVVLKQSLKSVLPRRA